jgi:hypothetical protein
MSVLVCVLVISVQQFLFLSFFGFPPPIIIPPLLHNHVSPPPELCDSRDQAAQYHILGLYVRASTSDSAPVYRTQDAIRTRVLSFHVTEANFIILI